MLPKFLVGSYKRYKADTDLFTAWLVETAAKAGHQLELGRQTTEERVLIFLHASCC